MEDTDLFANMHAERYSNNADHVSMFDRTPHSTLHTQFIDQNSVPHQNQQMK